jgi:predicted esterase
LKARTHELASFIRESTASYRLDADNIIAVGYSNGANVASSLLLLHPGLLKAAVLFHPMVPFVPEVVPDLSNVPIFIGAARHDEIVPPEETERLATLLENCRADVSVYWGPGGHGLSPAEVEAARRWLTRYL